LSLRPESNQFSYLRNNDRIYIIVMSTACRRCSIHMIDAASLFAVIDDQHHSLSVRKFLSSLIYRCCCCCGAQIKTCASKRITKANDGVIIHHSVRDEVVTGPHTECRPASRSNLHGWSVGCFQKWTITRCNCVNRQSPVVISALRTRV